MGPMLKAAAAVRRREDVRGGGGRVRAAKRHRPLFRGVASILGVGGWWRVLSGEVGGLVGGGGSADVGGWGSNTSDGANEAPGSLAAN